MVTPSAPFYSICCDASFKKYDSGTHSAIGLILRNFTSTFERGSCFYELGKLDAEHAEIEGLLHAIRWADELNLHHVRFEIDAQNVVDAANRDYQKIRWESHAPILDIIGYLIKYPTWTCNFISKKLNKPADKLAKHSRSFQVSKIWIRYPPNFVASVLHADIINVTDSSI